MIEQRDNAHKILGVIDVEWKCKECKEWTNSTHWHLNIDNERTEYTCPKCGRKHTVFV